MLTPDPQWMANISFAISNVRLIIIFLLIFINITSFLQTYFGFKKKSNTFRGKFLRIEYIQVFVVNLIYIMLIWLPFSLSAYWDSLNDAFYGAITNNNYNNNNNNNLNLELEGSYRINPHASLDLRMRYRTISNSSDQAIRRSIRSANLKYNSYSASVVVDETPVIWKATFDSKKDVLLTVRNVSDFNHNSTQINSIIGKNNTKIFKKENDNLIENPNSTAILSQPPEKQQQKEEEEELSDKFDRTGKSSVSSFEFHSSKNLNNLNSKNNLNSQLNSDSINLIPKIKSNLNNNNFYYLHFLIICVCLSVLSFGRIIHRIFMVSYTEDDSNNIGEKSYINGALLFGFIFPSLMTLIIEIIYSEFFVTEFQPYQQNFTIAGYVVYNMMWEMKTPGTSGTAFKFLGTTRFCIFLILIFIIMKSRMIKYIRNYRSAEIKPWTVPAIVSALINIIASFWFTFISNFFLSIIMETTWSSGFCWGSHVILSISSVFMPVTYLIFEPYPIYEIEPHSEIHEKSSNNTKIFKVFNKNINDILSIQKLKLNIKKNSEISGDDDIKKDLKFYLGRDIFKQNIISKTKQNHSII